MVKIVKNNVENIIKIYVNILILVIVLIPLYYINKLSNINENISPNIVKLYSNKIFIGICVSIITITSLGIGGIGGPWLGLILAIIFLMLNTIVASKKITNHITEQFI